MGDSIQDDGGTTHPAAGTLDAAVANAYRQIFERNPQPMWVYDVETLRIVAVNEAAVAQYGYDTDTFTRMTIRELRPAVEHARLEQYIARRSGGRANAGTWRHQRRDGALLDVEIMSHDVDWGGRRARVVTAYDVTERLRRRLEVETSLTALTARFAMGADADLTDALGGVAAVVGATGVYLLVGADGRDVRCAGQWPRAAPVLKDAERQLLHDCVAARPLADAIVISAELPPAAGESEREAQLREQLAGDGVSALLALPVRGRDGSLFGVFGFEHPEPGRGWADEDIRALQHAAGILGKELERRRASRALRASEERLRLILGQLPAVLWTTDTELHATALQGARAPAEPAPACALDALALSDPAPGAEPGAALLDRLGVSEERAAVLDAHRRALAGEQAATEWRAGDRWMQAHVEPLYSEVGQVIGTVGIALDVTERRTLEEQLRYSQRMETVGRLAGGVAHDFNNILTSITGHASFLLESLSEQDERYADASEIRRAAERAASLTRQLLVYARKQVVQPEVLGLASAIDEMRGMLRPLLGQTHMLRSHIAPDAGSIVADRGQIEQVIMNLVLNARDAMPGGGTIDVHVANTHVREDDPERHSYVKPGAYVRMTVSDRGVGMDAETQAQVFEPFFTTKATGKGTGLGMSTVYATVKNCGGYVWVHSEPGRGTMVEVLLPRSGAPADPAAAAASSVHEPAPAPRPAERPHGGTIMLVEDEDSVRAILRRLLEGRGYHVLSAASGEEALELSARFDGHIHLLVTDVVMPGLNGRELADRFETLRPATRTLFMSGYTTDEIIRRGIVSEEIAFIEKPFVPAEFIARIGQVLAGGGA